MSVVSFFFFVCFRFSFLPAARPHSGSDYRGVSKDFARFWERMQLWKRDSFGVVAKSEIKWICDQNERSTTEKRLFLNFSNGRWRISQLMIGDCRLQSDSKPEQSQTWNFLPPVLPCCLSENKKLLRISHKRLLGDPVTLRLQSYTFITPFFRFSRREGEGKRVEKVDETEQYVSGSINRKKRRHENKAIKREIREKNKERTTGKHNFYYYA